MNTTTVRLMLALPFLSLGCSGTRVHVDYDRAFDFTALGTYGWEAAPEPDRPRSPVMGHIVAAIDRTLARKGFRAAEEGPDFVVAAQVDWELLESTVDWGSVDEESAWWRRDVESYSYEEGTLTVTMTVAQSPIWSGRAERVLESSRTPEQIRRIVDEAVQKLLADFPPGG